MVHREIIIGMGRARKEMIHGKIVWGLRRGV